MVTTPPSKPVCISGVIWAGNRNTKTAPTLGCDSRSSRPGPLSNHLSVGGWVQSQRQPSSIHGSFHLALSTSSAPQVTRRVARRSPFLKEGGEAAPSDTEQVPPCQIVVDRHSGPTCGHKGGGLSPCDEVTVCLEWKPPTSRPPAAHRPHNPHMAGQAPRCASRRPDVVAVAALDRPPREATRQDSKRSKSNSGSRSRSPGTQHPRGLII